ncbi:pilus assembly PilX family protein [Gayadomonas joobiniege]|uniref:pilus assembly PilX family protein n=1 Tax=Gayadomonas joobiniege TaxID=1234606 RepID=UPI00037B0270|nr:pilus assembly PilX N-terminal domain-containing protein [Gayadomonas joobiniege]
MAQLIHKPKQQGAALAVGLVLMTVLTTLAVTLMYNSALDTKMSTAAAVKNASVNAALGGSDEFIYRATRKDAMFGGVNPLTMNQDIAKKNLEGQKVTAEAEALNAVPTNCPHFDRSDASDSYIQCNRFEVKVDHKYGKRDQGNSQVVTSVASQIPGVN